jgi:hypothetical protein
MRLPPLILTALVFGLILPLRAQQLSASSPFLPAGSAATGPGGSTPGGAIELRGEMSTSEGMQFCIYDTTKKVSTWVKENEKGNDFLVKAHDANNDSVTVAYQGRTMFLRLKETKVASSGLAAAPTLNNGMVGQPLPADDAQKIQAIAAEVARRRMLREQDLQKANAPGAPPPQPMVVPQRQPRQPRQQ